MSLNAATIEFLLARGLSGEDLLEVARRSEARSDPTAAARMARYRERKAEEEETRNVTRNDGSAKEKSPKPSKENTPQSNPKGLSPRRLPDDFVMPDDWKQWARETRGWSVVDIETEAANFIDYWQARGSGATKRDWRKTWQTWVRNSKRPDGAHRNGSPAEPFDQAEYDARLERIGRRDSTGPPRPIGDIAKQVIREATH